MTTDTSRPAPASEHHDDVAVDRFAAAMKAKLADARNKGRSGWDDPEQCSVEFLASLLLEHIGKGNTGNFEDIANLCMMLHQRGADPAILQAIAPAPVWRDMDGEPTHENWGVTVYADGVSILSIESNFLSGRHLSDMDEATIAMAASHLLSFLGHPTPAPVTQSGEQPGQGVRDVAKLTPDQLVEEIADRLEKTDPDVEAWAVRWAHQISQAIDAPQKDAIAKALRALTEESQT